MSKTVKTIPFREFVKPIPGIVTPEEAEFLRRKAYETDKGCVIKIGRWRGRAVTALALGVAARPAAKRPRVYAIDPYDAPRPGETAIESRHAFYDSMLRNGCADIVLLVNLPVYQAIAGWRETVGLLFVDGDNSVELIKAAVNSWLPHMGEGAMLLLGGTANPDSGASRLLAEFKAGGFFEVQDQEGQITALRCVKKTIRPAFLRAATQTKAKAPAAPAVKAEKSSPDLHRLDNRAIPGIAGEIRAVMVTRNEALRLPAVLDYHRDLGVGRFLMIDNGSDDGTIDFLLAQPDVHVFSSKASFAANKMRWTNTVLDAHADKHWTLTIDADELYVYPHCERVKLAQFCRFLESAGARATLSLLLDMYSDKPIDETLYNAGEPLLDACRYFDPGPYSSIVAPLFPHVQYYGGMRERVFRHRQRTSRSPTLSKVPLVKWQAGMQYSLATHAVTPTPLSDVVTALLHFKFLGDFRDRVASALESGQYHDASREYRDYHAYLRENGAGSFLAEDSVRYEDSAQLTRLDLMRSSPAYEDFVAALA